MNGKLFLVGLALLCTADAFALPDPVRPPDTYFLVDASSSMAQGSNWEDAKHAVAMRWGKIKLSDGSARISITSFGGSKEYGCQTAVEITPPAAADAAEWNPALPQGTTVVGGALKAAIEKIGVSDSTVYLVTDGGEQCAPTLCEVAAHYLPTRPQIRVEVLYTEDATSADKNRLSCIADAQRRQVTALDGSPLMPTISPEPDPYAIWWLLPIPILVALSAMFLSFHFSHRTKLIRNEIKEIGIKKDAGSEG